MHYRLKFKVWFSEPQVPGRLPAYPAEVLCRTSGLDVDSHQSAHRYAQDLLRQVAWLMENQHLLRKC